MRISVWSSDVCSSDLIWPSGVWYGASHRPGGFGYIPQRCPPKRHPEHQRQPDRRTTRGCRKSVAGEVRRFVACGPPDVRSEEHTSELQSLMRISYAVFCLKKKNVEIAYTKRTSTR